MTDDVVAICVCNMSAATAASSLCAAAADIADIVAIGETKAVYLGQCCKRFNFMSHILKSPLSITYLFLSCAFSLRLLFGCVSLCSVRLEFHSQFRQFGYTLNNFCFSLLRS